jgi:hypothetical protein
VIPQQERLRFLPLRWMTNKHRLVDRGTTARQSRISPTKEKDREKEAKIIHKIEEMIERA